MSQYIISQPASRDLPDIYQVGEDRIEIVRVVSGKRNLKDLFANPEEE